MKFFTMRCFFILALALPPIGLTQSVVNINFSYPRAEAAEPSPSAPQDKPDAAALRKGEKIPKNSLMLGLYCNTVNEDVQKHYNKSHSAPPWRASGKREEAFNAVFKALDHDNSGNTQAVKEGMLSEKEVLFLYGKAKKDAQLWINNIDEVCGKIPEGEGYSDCQRMFNTEIYKCYVYLEERVAEYLKSH